MRLIGELAVPLIIAFVMIYALIRGTDVFLGMTDGAKDGLKTVVGIVPALITLLPCIYMLRASGALDALCALLQPILSQLGIPAETVPLMLLRPLSGSGALAVGSDIIKQSGADSFVGRCAAVMLGSTETTFYVIAVYFGAAGVRNSRHAIPAALIADFVGFLAAAFFVKVFWG
ncbi:MAG: spore maturation protein [Oscillospiraceae bacterium]|nr:spore maturation protein [Oscillospiraceae bacterium]